VGRRAAGPGARALAAAGLAARGRTPLRPRPPRGARPRCAAPAANRRQPPPPTAAAPAPAAPPPTRDSVLSLCWSLNCEHQLLSGDAAGEVRLWDVRRPGSRALLDYTATSAPLPRRRAKRARGGGGGPGRVLAHDAGVTSILASPDGLHWVTGGRDARLRLWDAASRRHLLVHYPGAANPGRRPVRLAASEDGRWLFQPCGTAIQVRPRGAARGRGGAGCREQGPRPDGPACAHPQHPTRRWPALQALNAPSLPPPLPAPPAGLRGLHWRAAHAPAPGPLRARDCVRVERRDAAALQRRLRRCRARMGAARAGGARGRGVLAAGRRPRRRGGVAGVGRC
jgi:hypothetical protein